MSPSEQGALVLIATLLILLSGIPVAFELGAIWIESSSRAFAVCTSCVLS
jgi:hypothetical protein